MPLRRARAIVHAADRFGPATGKQTDLLWAALLSLSDHREFVREASRISWSASPPGMHSTAPVDRFGAGVLPWLRGFLHRGTLRNQPWCVVPCLLAIESRAAFDVVWQVRRVVGDAHTRIDLVREWIFRHPHRGHAYLAALARRGDRRALALLRELTLIAPDRVLRDIRRAAGRASADATVRALALTARLSADGILALLDRCARGDLFVEGGAWPSFRGGAPHREYHALRLVAARAHRGDGWGIALDCVRGDCEDGRWPAHIARFRYGSHVRPGAMPEPLALGVFVDDHEPGGVNGVEVAGPAGVLRFQRRMARSLDLRPGRYCDEHDDVEDADFVLLLRAYLATFPGAVFGDARDAAAALGLGAEPVVLAASDAFEHVVGSNVPSPRRTVARFYVDPSASIAYRSLAEAIVARDPTLFRPGATSTDWRIHAFFRRGARQG